MTFPSVVSVTNTNVATSTSVAFNLPASPTVGQLLLADIVASGTPVTPTGWTLIGSRFSIPGIGVTGGVYARVVTGTDSLNQTFNGGASASAGGFVYQLDPWSGTIADILLATQTGTLDPPALTMGANTDNLWIASCANAAAVSGAPTNYTGLATVTSGSLRLATAYRQLTAGSEDPGVFGGTATSATSWTVGVAPLSSVRAQTGVCAIGTAATATPRKVAVESSSAIIGATSSAVERKVAVEVGLSATGLAGTSTPRKAAPQTGVVAIGLTAQRSGTPARAQTGVCSLGVTTTGTPRKTAVETGTATGGLSGLSTAVKRAPQTGLVAVGLTATRSGVIIRAVSGVCALGLGGGGVARKVAPQIAVVTCGLTVTGRDRKVVPGSGTVVTALAGTGVSRKTVLGKGAGCVGLSGRGLAGKRSTQRATVTVGLSATALTPPPVTGGWPPTVTGPFREPPVLVSGPYRNDQVPPANVLVGPYPDMDIYPG